MDREVRLQAEVPVTLIGTNEQELDKIHHEGTLIIEP